MTKYHQNGTRSFPNQMANWFNASPQSRIGIVHFSEAFLIAKYSILNIALSFTKINGLVRQLRTFGSSWLSHSLAVFQAISLRTRTLVRKFDKT
ncbi:MAG: hypothetical protein LBV17_11710, partial [Treponema sp.]|nr:hypothetical protein [Treponema sp.]